MTEREGGDRFKEFERESEREKRWEKEYARDGKRNKDCNDTKQRKDKRLTNQ